MHVAPLDWIRWAVVIALQFYIMHRAWNRLPVLAGLMIYETIACGVGIAMIFGNLLSYAKLYMGAGIFEYALIGAAAIELCGKLQPQGYQRVIRFCPIVIAGPLFFQLVLSIPLLALFQFQLHALAFTLSAIILLICYLFEETGAPDWVGPIAAGYFSLLFLLVIAIGLVYRFHNTGIWNHSIPIAWLIGMAVLGWTLRPQRGGQTADR
jgi:hypothetical protein